MDILYPICTENHRYGAVVYNVTELLHTASESSTKESVTS